MMIEKHNLMKKYHHNIIKYHHNMEYHHSIIKSRWNIDDTEKLQQINQYNEVYLSDNEVSSYLKVNSTICLLQRSKKYRINYSKIYHATSQWDMSSDTHLSCMLEIIFKEKVTAPNKPRFVPNNILSIRLCKQRI